MVALNVRCLAILCVVCPSAALHAQPNMALEAPLNEAGYQKVASLKSDEEMKNFIKRILFKLGLDVADEGQLSGFAAFYSGTQAVQHYDKLQNELKVVPWVQKLPAESKQSTSQAPPVHAVKAKAALPKTHAKKVHAAVANGKKVAAMAKAAAVTTTAAPTTAAATTTAHAMPAKTSTAAIPHQAQDASTDAEVVDAEGLPAHVDAAKRSKFLGLGVRRNDTPAAAAIDAPYLPAVNEVLSSASKNLEVFTANADQMRKKADEMQQASKRNLTLLKAHYVTRLNSLKAEHDQLIARNEELRSNISSVNATNDVLEKQAKSLQESIDILHETFSVLLGRVEMAEGFIGDSLNSTEVDDAPEVQVLAPTTPKPTLASYLLDARRGLGLGSIPSTASPDNLDDALALLQVAAGRTVDLFEGDESAVAAKDPAKMTSFLLRTLEKLGEAEKAAKQQLKDHFTKAKAKWTERNGELVAEGSHLKSQLDAVTKRRTDLEAVKASLLETNDLLKKKLAEFAEFLNFLDKVVDNTVDMASTNKMLRA